MIQQLDFMKETGLPRWGCLWLSMVMAPFAFFHRAPDYETVMQIYIDCRRKKLGGKNALVNEGQERDWRLVMHWPDIVLRTALGYVETGYDAAQFRDTEFSYPALPKEYPGLTYTLLAFERPAGYHWVLGDKLGRNILYNPDEQLDIDPWKRAPVFRGVQIWAE